MTTGRLLTSDACGHPAATPPARQYALPPRCFIVFPGLAPVHALSLMWQARVKLGKGQGVLALNLDHKISETCVRG